MDESDTPESLFEYFERDHARLGALLERATEREGEIAAEPYGEFRKGLLRHIGMEEKILLPAVKKARGGESLPMAGRLRLDHGAIAALLVPPPSPQIIRALRAILDHHNRLEEEGEGLYTVCERLGVEERTTLLKKARESPEVPAMPFNPAPFVLDATRRALARAGYDFDEFE